MGTSWLKRNCASKLIIIKVFGQLLWTKCDVFYRNQSSMVLKTHRAWFFCCSQALFTTKNDTLTFKQEAFLNFILAFKLK